VTSSALPASKAGLKASPSRTTPGGPKLTSRQQQILKLFVAGRTRAQIAQELGGMPGTVGDYIKDLYLRLGVHDARAAVAAARKASLIQAARADQ
jgi:DNA-binding NarL/FixJ family response regulator